MLTYALHPYQNEAVDRAIERGSLLIAWEMGLGKTIAGLAIAEELLGEEEIDLAAVVVPSSLKWQWAQQIAAATDVQTTTRVMSLNGQRTTINIPAARHAIVVDGSKSTREKQYRQILETRPEYVILSYEHVVNDWKMVRRIKPGLIMLDEATAIKTFKAQRTKKVKRWSADYRVALTGTPMENGKPEEIFSIMQWVDADVLGRFDLFDKAYIVRNAYGGVVRYKNLPVLNAKLADVMDRQTRSNPHVAKYLPKLQETDLWVDIDKDTREVYNEIGLDLLGELQAVPPGGQAFDLFTHYHGGADGGDFENTQQGKIAARMLALDLLLDHPDLIRESAKNYAESQRQRDLGIERANWKGSAYCAEIAESGLLDDLDVSPKLTVLVDVVEKAATSSPENKIIVFSRFPTMGRIIGRALDVKSVEYHGEMNGSQKAAAVAQFRDDPDTRVILCSHAGAFGTDLNMANYLINYDLAWSAGVQDQINARHQRASSAFEHVHVINLLCAGTTEARKPEVLEFKRRTASAIVDGKGADKMGRIDKDVQTLGDYLRETIPKRLQEAA